MFATPKSIQVGVTVRREHGVDRTTQISRAAEVTKLGDEDLHVRTWRDNRC